MIKFKKLFKLVLIGNLFFISISVLIPLITFFDEIFNGSFDSALKMLFNVGTAEIIGLDILFNLVLDLFIFILASPVLIISLIIDKVTSDDYAVGTVKEDDFDKWLKENGNTEANASKPKANAHPKEQKNRYNRSTNRGYSNSNTYNYTNSNTNTAPDAANYNYLNMSSNNADNINSYKNVNSNNVESKKTEQTGKKKSFFTNRKKVNPSNKANYEDYISWQMLREEWASIQDHDDDMLKN